MGFDARKKSGNILAGSRLIVEGLGILTVKGDQKISIVKNLPKNDAVSEGNRPTPTPSNTPTNTPTPN
jgi:hypothetical protein